MRYDLTQIQDWLEELYQLERAHLLANPHLMDPRDFVFWIPEPLRSVAAAIESLDAAINSICSTTESEDARDG